jgi:acyl-CoA synthetase (AMP-forming)/AMP-acid ligase II
MNHPSYYATLNPDKVAYVMADSGESLTYGQLDDASNRGAHVLRSAGIGPGGHVALLVENSLAFFEICWSAQRSGIYYTAISTHLKAPEVAYIVKDCGATLLYITARLLDGVLGEIRATTPDVRIVTVDERVPGFEFMPDLVAQQPATPIADECFGRDLLYSSGTTGRPKGVNVTFVREPIATVTSLLVVIGQQMCGMGTDTVYLSPAPLYHAAPLRFTMLCCSLGGTAVIMRKFDAETYLRLVQAHRVTLTQVVPTMFVRMLKLPAEVRASYDVSSLRGAIHAAAPCPQDVKQAMIDWWGPILIEYYAGTEANGVTIIDSHEWLTHPGSVGRSRVGRIEILGEDREGPSLPPRPSRISTIRRKR